MTKQKLDSLDIGSNKPRMKTRSLILILAFCIISVVIIFLITLQNMDAPKRNYGLKASMPVGMLGKEIFLDEIKDTELGLGVVPKMASSEQPAFKWPSFTRASFCTGEETACITTVSKKPSETLRKMASAIPPGMAKQYKVSISITPIEN